MPLIVTSVPGSYALVLSPLQAQAGTGTTIASQPREDNSTLYSAMTAWSAVALVLATVSLAWYTYRLWRSTGAMARSAERNSVEAKEAVAEQIRMLGRQLNAMEIQAVALGNLAEAALQQAQTARHQLAVDHPAMLRITGAMFLYVQPATPRISFSLLNEGHSDAILHEASLLDYFVGLVDSSPESGLYPKITSEGYSAVRIRPGETASFEHTCQHVTWADVGPKMTLEDLLPLLKQGPERKPSGGLREIRFKGHIVYRTETGYPLATTFDVGCKPPVPFFTEDLPRHASTPFG